MNYELLLDEAAEEGIIVKKPLLASDGRLIGTVINNYYIMFIPNLQIMKLI